MMNKPKVDPFEYLGLKDDDDDDAFEWMKPKQTDTKPKIEQGIPSTSSETRPKTGEQRLPPTPQPLEQKQIDQSPDDYLGLGGEVDLDSILK